MRRPVGVKRIFWFFRWTRFFSRRAATVAIRTLDERSLVARCKLAGGWDFFINHGRFTFQFDGVVLEGPYLGQTKPFSPALTQQYGVLVGDMGGPFIVTKVVAAKNACTAPADLSSVCSKGKWTGTVRFIPTPTPSCLLSLEFKSDGAARR